VIRAVFCPQRYLARLVKWQLDKLHHPAPRTNRRLAALRFIGPLACCVVTMSGCATRADFGGLSAQKDEDAAEKLHAAFRNPPREARPQLWWHWIGGNIAPDKLIADLDWMERIGIRGVHIFDVELPGPQVVDHPLKYRTPEWNAAFLQAMEGAQRRGMSVGVAASPGWSESGGPWVLPEDAMKKLTWSTLDVQGGQAIDIMLAPPPATVGPFLDAAPAADFFAAKVPPPQPLYRDVALVAVPIRLGAPLPRPTFSLSGKDADPSSLLDGRLTTEMDLPSGTTWLRYDFPVPVTVRGSTLAQPASTPIEPTQAAAVLEADRGKGFEAIGHYEPGNSPQQTISFAPVQARSFRLRFEKPTAKGTRLLEWRLSAGASINQFETKAGFDQATDYIGLSTERSLGLKAPAATQVQVLTSAMDGNGRFRWQAPPGLWRLYRFGWSLTGKTNHPATREATGLEVDKLDAEAVQRYADAYLNGLAGIAPLGPDGLSSITVDSIEVGAQNWTAHLAEEFKRRRGYDLTPYLPALAGTIVGDSDQSDRFLFDWRQTLGELLKEAHYGTLASAARKRGMTSYMEAMEFARTAQGDDMALRQYADIPMAAMWSFPGASDPLDTALADMRGAASIAHIHGRPLVAAELLTSMDQLWQFSPSDLRPMIDRAFAAGINRPIIHSSVHQPGNPGKPGLTLGVFGQTFNRTETWAEIARPWIDYIARNAYLLQQGKNVADILYAYGEDTPLVTLYGEGGPKDVPPGFAYDFVDASSLREAVSGENGHLVTKGGAEYSLLWLGGTSRRITLATLRALDRLTLQGGIVAGPRPVGSPSLADDSAVVTALIDRLWNPASPRIIESASLKEALDRLRIEPEISADGNLAFVHRRSPESDFYFLANTGSSGIQTVTFRGMSGLVPQLWHAEDGTSERAIWAPSPKGTNVTLTLPAKRSVFVRFAHGPALHGTRARDSVIAQLDGGWTFEAPGHAVQTVTLGSWTEPGSGGLATFSGTASYKHRFAPPPRDRRRDERLLLDLGNVGDVAEIILNGRSVGTLWEAPWQIDISDYFRHGENSLEVRVTNLWINNLIGEARAGRQSFGVPASETARPSGILGPVRLIRRTSED